MTVLKKDMTSPESKIRQLQHQSDTWKRDIEFLMQENVILKTRLAEIVSAKNITPELLEKAEEYQNSFIANDELIRLIRGEIVDLDKLLIKEYYLNGKAVEEKVSRSQKKISAETEAFTKDFIRLKFDFNNYMTGIIGRND